MVNVNLYSALSRSLQCTECLPSSPTRVSALGNKMYIGLMALSNKSVNNNVIASEQNDKQLKLDMQLTFFALDMQLTYFAQACPSGLVMMS